MDTFFNSILGNLSTMSQLMPRLKNIDYDAQTNTTTIYGHTNFEELKVNGGAVALQTHTHKTDSITRDVTTINEEEEEVTESVALNDILDGKCETVHTHSSADIANWATATENFAKLNANNTFTGENTFNGAITINGATNYIYSTLSSGAKPLLILAPNLSSNSEGVGFFLGKSRTNGNAAYIEYMYKGNNNSESALCFGFHGNDRLYVFRQSKVDIRKPLTIDYSASAGAIMMYILNSGLGSNKIVTLLFGKAASNNNCMNIRYYNESTRKVGFGFYGNDNIIAMNSDKSVSMAGTLTTTGDITANGVNIITALNGKAEAIHSHKTDDITRDITTINEEEEETTETVALNDILDGKAEAEHTHAISDIANLQTTLDGKASSSHNHDSAYAAINHNHDSAYAATSHTHAISDIANLQTTLDGKASSSHNHDSAYAPTSHTHAISDIANLQTTLDGKASSSHNHDSAYAAINHNHDSAYAATSHTHAISDITNLQTSLNGKASASTPMICDVGTSNVTVSATSHEIVISFNCEVLSSGTVTVSVDFENNNPERSEIVFTLNTTNETVSANTTISNTTTYTSGEIHCVINDYNITRCSYEGNTLKTTQPVDTNEFLSAVAFNYQNHNHDTKYAATSHTHAISEITNLQTTLDGKASSSHNHDSAYAATSHTHTSSQLTDLNALKIEIFKMIYPVGSIYISTTLIDNESYVERPGNFNDYCIYWNDCEWKLLDDGVFLRNSSVKRTYWYNEYEERYYTTFEINQAGAKGGSETHTHTTGDFKLLETHMPSHTHGCVGAGGHGHTIGHYGWYSTASGSRACLSSANIPGDELNTDGFYCSWVDNHAHTINSTGGNTAHNHGNTGSASNLPPYLTVYMYKRIA